MGIFDLLLNRGRGVGELKNLGTLHGLNSTVIRAIKELDSVDQKAEEARQRKDYGTLFACIRRQVMLLDKVQYYAVVRMVRAEYAYRDVAVALEGFRKHCREKERLLNAEERRLSPEGKKHPQVRARLDKAKSDLARFGREISALQDSVRDLRKAIREGCRKKILKLKRIYHFA